VRGVKQEMEHAGHLITVYKRGSRAAACRSSVRRGKLRAIQNKADWRLWASTAAIGARGDEKGSCDGRVQGT
jgi:hypothetical protein